MECPVQCRKADDSCCGCVAGVFCSRCHRDRCRYGRAARAMDVSSAAVTAQKGIKAERLTAQRRAFYGWRPSGARSDRTRSCRDPALAAILVSARAERSFQLPVLVQPPVPTTAGVAALTRRGRAARFFAKRACGRQPRSDDPDRRKRGAAVVSLQSSLDMARYSNRRPSRGARNRRGEDHDGRW